MKEKKKKLTQIEIDGVQYRRAKMWQIICYDWNGKLQCKYWIRSCNGRCGCDFDMYTYSGWNYRPAACICVRPRKHKVW